MTLARWGGGRQPGGMTRDRFGNSGAAVVVTGATGGIGAAYVEAFTAAGANVVALDVAERAQQGKELCERFTGSPGEAVFVAADITEDEDLAAAVATAADRFGGIQALVNNAAIYGALGGKRPLGELTNDQWDLVLRVNVRGVWQAIKAVAPTMTAGGGGRVVNISSATARAGTANFAHYVASKAAVEGLTRAAAKELGPVGITVNCVAPGLVSDEATATLNTPDYIARLAQLRAVPREMTPADLVGAVLWLSSPDSAFVTGQTVVVDGGQVFV
jgi:NAD(P)-dependent dehydrogenase (short-subunit alcohol dehydrogenase family)